MTWVTSLSARAVALLGVLLCTWIAWVHGRFLAPALEDPMTWDGGGGLDSLAWAAGSSGLATLTCALLGLMALAGALVGPWRTWLALLTLVLPALAALLAAGVAAGVAWTWLPDEPAYPAIVGVSTAVPALVVLVAGAVATLNAVLVKRQKAAAAGRKAQAASGASSR